MKRILLTALFTAGLAGAQSPIVGIIDFYGLREAKESAVREALGVEVGGKLPHSKVDTELAIEEVPEVVRARLEAVCCEDGKAILYVGIEERGAPHFALHSPPEELVLLPEEIHDAYVMFLASLGEAVHEGVTEEDLTQGHSLMADAASRSHQEKFITLAAEHLNVIRDVLRNSMNEEHRAIAAYVIGYVENKSEVVDDLMYALRDSDATVRSNAMRALAAIEVLARRKPSLTIKIPPTWLIEMLNSLIWTDRTTAAVNLVNLTEARDGETLTQLRERAMPALIDMARWKHLAHALPAYILLGRILGLEESAIQERWAGDDRLSLVEEAAEAAKSKS